jgi:hypothetical protein
MLSGAALKANSKGSIPKRRKVTKLWPDSKRRGHRLQPNWKRQGGKVAKWCVKGARTRTKRVFGKRARVCRGRRLILHSCGLSSAIEGRESDWRHFWRRGDRERERWRGSHWRPSTSRSRRRDAELLQWAQESSNSRRKLKLRLDFP